MRSLMTLSSAELIQISEFPEPLFIMLELGEHLPPNLQI